MIDDGTYTAALDRIVDGEHAVLLIEADGDVIDELVVPPSELPADGRHEGAILEVTIADDELSSVSYDAERTERRRKRAQERFDRLAERPPDRDDS